jgi:hypothetical protein
MATPAVGRWARCVGGVFGIGRPVFRQRVRFLSLSSFVLLTDSQVLITTLESKRRAAAKAEKEKKSKQKARDAAKAKKVDPPAAGSSRPSKVVLRKSLLFSSRGHLRLT